MTPFDYAVMATLALSMLLGLWRGLAREVLALIAWAAALWVASRFGDYGSQALSSFVTEPWLQQVLGYALVFGGVLMLGAGIAALIRLMLSAVGLGVLDRLLGGLFGLARGVLILLVAVLLCGLTRLPEQPWWAQAKWAPPLETAVLAARPWLPEGIASQIRFPLR